MSVLVRVLVRVLVAILRGALLSVATVLAGFALLLFWGDLALAGEQKPESPLKAPPPGGIVWRAGNSPIARLLRRFDAGRP